MAAGAEGVGQIAANEAQHLSTFSQETGGHAFRLSFPPPLTSAQATTAMAAYTS